MFFSLKINSSNSSTFFVVTKKSYITIKGKEYIARIDEINDRKISLIFNDIDIKINLENNEISATNNKNIYFLNCEESNFNI